MELMERHEQQKEKRREKERKRRLAKQTESMLLEQEAGENENGESVDKRDAAKTKEYLAENGLTHFKKVTLNLGSQRTSIPRSTTPDPLAQKPATPFSPNNRAPPSTNPKRGSDPSPPSSPSKRQRVYPNATSMVCLFSVYVVLFKQYPYFPVLVGFFFERKYMVTPSAQK